MGLGIAGPPCDSPGKQAIRRQAGEAGGRAPTMADGNEKTWWRRTRFLAVTAVMTGGAASLFIMLAAPALDADSVLGKCTDMVRLPMVPVSEKTRITVRNAMVHAGLIN